MVDGIIQKHRQRRHIEKLLKNSDSTLRFYAVNYLSKCYDSWALTHLVRQMNDIDKDIRDIAVFSLGSFPLESTNTIRLTRYLSRIFEIKNPITRIRLEKLLFHLIRSLPTTIRAEIPSRIKIASQLSNHPIPCESDFDYLNNLEKFVEYRGRQFQFFLMKQILPLFQPILDKSSDFLVSIYNLSYFEMRMAIMITMFEGKISFNPALIPIASQDVSSTLRSMGVLVYLDHAALNNPDPSLVCKIVLKLDLYVQIGFIKSHQKYLTCSHLQTLLQLYDEGTTTLKESIVPILNCWLKKEPLFTIPIVIEYYSAQQQLPPPSLELTGKFNGLDWTDLMDYQLEVGALIHRWMRTGDTFCITLLECFGLNSLPFLDRFLDGFGHGILSQLNRTRLDTLKCLCDRLSAADCIFTRCPELYLML